MYSLCTQCNVTCLDLIFRLYPSCYTFEYHKMELKKEDYRFKMHCEKENAINCTSMMKMLIIFINWQFILVIYVE